MKKKTILFGILGLLALCLVIGFIASLGDDTQETASVTSSPAAGEPLSQAPIATNTAIPPTETPTPTTTPEPTQTLPPEEALRQLLIDELGSSNRKVERLTTLEVGDPVVIEFTVNDNLTEDFIRLGAKLDFVDILKVFSESDLPYSKISIAGTFPLVDVYGNSKETMVVYGLYTKETIDKINFENFITDNVYILAEETFIAPAFRDTD